MIVAGHGYDVRTPAREPSLLIALTSGKERWIAANTTERISNTATEPMEFLRFDFKTSPLAPPGAR